MTFEEVLDQAIAMLQRRGRPTYRTLRRQFQLDEAHLEALNAELIDGQRLAIDEDDTVLVWTGESAATSHRASGARPGTRAADLHAVGSGGEDPHLQSALEGERKQVTVLFADLKGSMELLADRDPEEARQLLDPVLERMMAAVHGTKGTVNQIQGDGIMALFGRPWRMRTMPCGPVMRRWPCRRPWAVTVRRPAARMGSRSRSASGSTPGRWWSGPSAMTCAWTIRPSGRRPTWRPAWSSSGSLGHSPDRSDPPARRGLDSGHPAGARPGERVPDAGGGL